jgi:hypothetical protein
MPYLRNIEKGEVAMKTLKWRRLYCNDASRNDGNGEVSYLEAYVGNVTLYQVKQNGTYGVFDIHAFVPRCSDIPLWDRTEEGARELVECLYLAFIANIQHENGACPYGEVMPQLAAYCG